MMGTTHIDIHVDHAGFEFDCPAQVRDSRFILPGVVVEDTQIIVYLPDIGVQTERCLEVLPRHLRVAQFLIDDPEMDVGVIPAGITLQALLVRGQRFPVTGLLQIVLVILVRYINGVIKNLMLVLLKGVTT